MTIRLWKSLRKNFERRIVEVGLRRDVFLAHLVRVELPRLDHEVPGTVSKRGAMFIRHQLKRLDMEPVTIRLPKDLVESIDEICTRKHIVRDAFFNRLILALCITPEAFLSLTDLGRLDIPELLIEEGWKTRGEQFSSGALATAASVLNDPLWVIRACLEAASKREGVEGMYTFYEIPLSFEKVKGFQGLNVYSEQPADLEIDLDDLLASATPKSKRESVK
jgi:hypothetical protein